MKKLLFLFVFLLGFALVGNAETPFSQAAFDKSQKANEKILLAFHAPWCPTCVLQNKNFSEMEKQGALKGVTYYVVDYDKEQQFKQLMKVHTQGTLILFKGNKEVSRVMGITEIKMLKPFIDTASN